MTSILSIMAALGNIGAFLLPIFFVDPKMSNYGDIRHQIYTYFMMHTIVAAVLFILAIFMISDNKIEAIVANEEGNDQTPNTIPMATQFKCLFSDSVYVCMFLCAGIVFGMLGGMGGVVAFIVSVWGYPEVNHLIYLFNFKMF